MWWVGDSASVFDAVARDVLSKITEEALPFFSRFDDTEELVRTFLEDDDAIGREGVWDFGKRESPSRLLYTGFAAIECGKWDLAISSLRACQEKTLRIPEPVGERVRAITGNRGVEAVIELDLDVNAKLLPEVLAPRGIVVIYGSSSPQVSIPFQFLLQSSIALKFFLVYEMRTEERDRATADINRMLARGELIHNVAQTFALDDIVAAHEAVESGRATGNVVVRVG